VVKVLGGYRKADTDSLNIILHSTSNNKLRAAHATSRSA
jgi:hypothetical protein